MKRVLIISPHFPPVNAPDHQRIRMALPYFAENHWRPTILAAHPDGVAAPRDETLLVSLPDKLDVQFVTPLPLSFSHIPGLGTLSWRVYRALQQRGNALLRQHKFDLVFFSTTQFGTFSLGPYWKRRWNVPFALDLQDPWINSFYAEQGITPPGGVLKFTLQQKLAMLQAQQTIPAAAGLCAVSGDYIDYFERKQQVSTDCVRLTLPFPYAERDWQAAQNVKTSLPWSTHPRPNDVHWVYAGRGGADLHPCLTALFQSLQRHTRYQSADTPQRHLWFLGTHYGEACPQHQPIKALADRVGYPHVHEIPQRVPFLQALHIMRQSDGLMVPGSVDARYNPSKLISLLAAGKPLLTLAPAASPCAETMLQVAPENLLTYSLPLQVDVLCDTLCDYWERHSLRLPSLSADTSALAEREAQTSTRRLCQFMDNCSSHAQT